MTIAEQIIARFGPRFTNENGMAILAFGKDTSPDHEGWLDSATNKVFFRYADGSLLSVDTTTEQMTAEPTH
jgi:hypothetical protein